MMNHPEPAHARIMCPHCQQTLAIPSEAVGRSVSCTECQGAFHIPRNADGSPGVPVRPTPGRKVLAVPKQLFGPALALLLFGLAGTLVNGYLSLMFAFKPGSDLEFARMRVLQIRAAGALAETKRNANVPEDQQEKLLGPDAPLTPEEEALAEAWTPSMRPIHLIGTLTSIFTLIGGLCLLTGRSFSLAILGCLVSVVNVDPICCIPAGLAGLWGLLMLVRDDARAHFRQADKPT
ncbi:MAG: hypothetical protein LC104_08045 [Bacteroidales bacterium]|nr:hypothetical protein [Bacteroidales bacterium]